MCQKAQCFCVTVLLISYTHFDVFEWWQMALYSGVVSVVRVDNEIQFGSKWKNKVVLEM